MTCESCGDIGYYTTEGSAQACRAAGCVVVEDFDDGTCAILCSECKPSEAERIKAIPELMAWRQADDTVKFVVKAVLVASGEPSIGHLARNRPLLFDDLYDECSGLVRNPE